MVSSEKLLSCVFFLEIPCSYRKNEKSTILARCFKCSHYARFFREMDDEDQHIMDEIEEIHRGKSE